MNISEQRHKAEALRAMHDRKRILVLPNAWDAASAKIIAAAGFTAIATSSVGVAFTAGYADGEVIPRDDMVTITRWIAQSVDVPVTADIESGFGPEPKDVAETIRMIIDAGAVGVNLEDTVHGVQRRLYEIPVAVERIRAAREAAEKAGVPIVINGRSDVFIRGIGEKDSRFGHTVQRLNAYREAGADCLYPMGLFDGQTIARLVKAINGPINILGLAGMPAVAELERMGVARVSLASGPVRVAMAATRKMAEELARSGSFEVVRDAMSAQESNALFVKPQ